MRIAVVFCIHGNEIYGKEVASKLPNNVLKIIGNKQALKENRRFIEQDLNRSFPGKKEGNHEERIAYNLLNKLKDFEIVIDLHSSSNSCEMFGIITKVTKEKIELAKKLGLKRLVIMKDSIARGNSLIDHVTCGISLEVGDHKRPENVKEAVDCINNLLDNKNYNPKIEIYGVYGTIKKQDGNILIENFKEVEKGQTMINGDFSDQIATENFVPILVNEKAYKEILCLKSKRIN